MDSKVWKEFLNAESKDESKREANLVILGTIVVKSFESIGCSKANCLYIADGIMETLGQPPLKKRDIDVINYSYANVGYANRRNLNGGLR